MAVKRALVYQMGSKGPQCAAAEVAIEQGTKGTEGSIRPVRDCKKSATVVVNGTAFCPACGDAVAASAGISVVRQIIRR